jgi:tRNA modification GTPase
MFEDDIAAISTPPGEGGIAIVRVSGSGAVKKVDAVFQPRKKGLTWEEKPPYTLTLGWMVDRQGEIVDEVLVSVMRAPHSYTAEDVVEINCHGGVLPARRCLELILQQGARLAEPGEFTRRAFLNGRLDASQAEAVIEIIRARSDRAMRMALKQLGGRNSQLINRLEDRLIGINALVEASLDFPDDVGDPDYGEIKNQLEDISREIKRVINSTRRAEVYRIGIRLAIVGKPNVGKSSLLNELLHKERAIVTSVPGTTRDIIEDLVTIRGIPVRIMDTAGIRTTEDMVEQIGISKAREAIEEADLVLFMLDAGTGWTEEDALVLSGLDRERTIVLINKIDLPARQLFVGGLPEPLLGLPALFISLKEGQGLEEVEEKIEEKVLTGTVSYDDLEIMMNTRQKQALYRAGQHLEDASRLIGEVPLDCLGVDIWGAAEALGEITGKNLKEDIIERIFQDFCIGK